MKDKSVLITGGSGSFGRAFTRYVLEKNPRRVVIYSRGEHRQEEMERSLGADPRLRFYVGDVRDISRLEMAMRGVDYVIHAAAMKVVPKCETDPIEAIHTNIIGAENVIRASLKCGVQKVMALSTDKACSPVNLYGATKLAAEKLFVAAQNLRGDLPTRFAVVRYGNVWGSQGSVAPLFRKIAAGNEQNIPITHPEMTRFIITMDRAIWFVQQALMVMGGGEIYVPRIPSARILDIAQAVAPEKSYRIVGVRPGEKIHETLITDDESRIAKITDWGFVIKGDEQPTNLITASYRSDTNPEWLSVEQLRHLTS